MLTMLALSAVIATMLILGAFEKGLYRQVDQLLADRRAEVFVTQKGVSNFVAVRSSLRQSSRREIEAIKGVRQAYPVTTMPIIHGQSGVMMPVNMLVFDNYGGPAVIVQGNPIRDSRDIVVDLSIARKFAIKPGDPFTVFGHDFNVAGITQGAASFMTPYVFVSYDGLLDFIFASEIVPDILLFPLVSFLLVDLESSADAETVVASINESVAGMQAFTRAQLAKNDKRMIDDMLGAVLSLLVAISYVIGVLVVSLIIYVDVRSRAMSFAVLKALGFDFMKLVQSVLFQLLIMLAISFPVGLIAAVAVAGMIESMAPLYLLPVTDPGLLLTTAVACGIFSLLSAFCPLWLIRKTSPDLAFRMQQ